MTDDRDIRDVRRDAPDAHMPRSEMSTADLAVAAKRSAGGSTSDLDRKIDDREVERGCHTPVKLQSPTVHRNTDGVIAVTTPAMKMRATRRRSVRNSEVYVTPTWSMVDGVVVRTVDRRVRIRT